MPKYTLEDLKYVGDVLDCVINPKKLLTILKADAVFLFGRGENCTCSDCPVLYGGECYTTEENNKLSQEKPPLRIKK